MMSEERFTAGEQNSPVGYFERQTPRAWASGGGKGHDETS
jgi:hypothetical protein